MAELQDLPRLAREFIELAKAYLLQETVEPAKKLGYFGGMSIAAAAMWAAAVILLSVAGLRALYDLLPDSAYWEALAYIVFAILLIGLMALLVKLVPERGVHDGPQAPTKEGDA